jgi:Ser/Thr protein kinase RdoA (MazF antagonist)
MTTPILTHAFFHVPRPDRLYRQFRFRSHHPALELNLVEDILAEYGLRLQGRVEVPIGRSENVIFKTPAGKKMLKRYKKTLIPVSLSYEHSILNHLAQIDFPAPRLNPTVHGETLLQKDDRCYALFDVLEGYFQYHNYFLLPAQTRQFISMSGQALGALHNALRDHTPEGYHTNSFKSKEGDRRDLNWYIDKLDWCRQEIPRLQTDEAHVLSRMYAEHASWIIETLHHLNDRIEEAAPLRLIIHSDYGPYNLFFKPGASTVILDFELAHLDWRLADLAMALPYFAGGRLGFSVNKMNYFLAGYQTSCPIDPSELHLLPSVWLFLTLRRILFCWYRFCEAPADRWVAEAQQKLKLARWLITNQDMLSSRLSLLTAT